MSWPFPRDLSHLRLRPLNDRPREWSELIWEKDWSLLSERGIRARLAPVRLTPVRSPSMLGACGSTKPGAVDAPPESSPKP